MSSNKQSASQDFLTNVSFGLIDGHSPLFKFGRSSNVGAISTSVWDGSEPGILYPWQDAASLVTLSSSNSGDSFTLGTGIEQVEILGKNADVMDIFEFVKLDGQNPVSTTKEFFRIHTMIGHAAVLAGHQERAGLGDVYAGIGTVAAGIPDIVYAKILQGKNRTLMTQYTIAADKSALVVYVYIGTPKGQSANPEVYIAEKNDIFQVQGSADIHEGSYRRPLTVWPQLGPKTDIEVRATAGAPNTVIHADYSLVLKLIS